MRSFRRGISRRRKAPVMWERFSQLVTTSGSGTILQTPLSTPAFFDAATTVERTFTLKRIICSMTVRYQALIRLPNAIQILGLGYTIAEAPLNPLTSPFVPLQTDWMDLWNIEAQLPPGDTAVIPNGAQYWYERDTRVSRRVKTDEFLWLSTTTLNLGAPVDTTPTFECFMNFSLLWSGQESPRR